MYKVLSGATTPGQRGPASDGNERVFPGRSMFNPRSRHTKD